MKKAHLLSLAALSALCLTTACTTLTPLQPQIVARVQQALTERGLDGVISDAQIDEAVAIVQNTPDLMAIIGDVAADERVQAEVQRLVDKYILGIADEPTEGDANVPTLPQPATDANFSELRWDYGGFKGGGAAESDVRISSLVMSPNGLSFRYERDLASWGLAHSDAGALACLFVLTNDGKWVGGKFDWISSSRTSRSFTNINGGYNGWSLRDVPNPTRVRFVIVSRDGKRRSNVLEGEWRR